MLMIVVQLLQEINVNKNVWMNLGVHLTTMLLEEAELTQHQLCHRKIEILRSLCLWQPF